MPKIIIEVSGGVVQNVISNSKHVTYTVIDQDDLKAAGNCSHDLLRYVDGVSSFAEPQHIPALNPYIKRQLKKFKDLAATLRMLEYY